MVINVPTMELVILCLPPKGWNYRPHRTKPGMKIQGFLGGGECL